VASTPARGRRREAGERRRGDARTTAGGQDKRRNREVVDAAARVFHERGYADSSVQDVADELGILKGSLYYYIRTKEDLLYWLLEEVHEEVEKILEDVAAIEDLGALERLGEYIRRQTLHNAANLIKISVYYHDAEQLSGERRADIARRRRVHERFVIGQIAAAQEQGEVPADADPRLLANFVFANVIWIYRWYRTGGRLRREQLAEHTVRYVLAGLRQHP
jgi:AcrR family transcriptional regulator